MNKKILRVIKIRSTVKRSHSGVKAASGLKGNYSGTVDSFLMGNNYGTIKPDFPIPGLKEDGIFFHGTKADFKPNVKDRVSFKIRKRIRVNRSGVSRSRRFFVDKNSLEAYDVKATTIPDFPLEFVRYSSGS